eukprot:g20271.t1
MAISAAEMSVSLFMLSPATRRASSVSVATLAPSTFFAASKSAWSSALVPCCALKVGSFSCELYPIWCCRPEVQEMPEGSDADSKATEAPMLEIATRSKEPSSPNRVQVQQQLRCCGQKAPRFLQRIVTRLADFQVPFLEEHRCEVLCASALLVVAGVVLSMASITLENQEEQRFLGMRFVCIAEGRLSSPAFISAATLASAADAELRDLRGRRGPRLRELLQRARPTVLLLVAGGCDLSLHGAVPEVLRSLQTLALEAVKAAPETILAMMAVPDAGRAAEQASMLGAALTTRRQDLNRALAQWSSTQPMAYVNSGALLPHGPRSMAAGYWDGPLLSTKGAHVLSGRLACALLPQVMRRRQHEDGWEWRAEPLDLGDEGEVPSLEAFMKAFSLEDEAEAKSAALGAPLGANGAPAPPWEVSAAVQLQRSLRFLLGAENKAQRLALARLSVRQRLSRGTSWQPRLLVTSAGLRLSAG